MCCVTSQIDFSKEFFICRHRRASGESRKCNKESAAFIAPILPRHSKTLNSITSRPLTPNFIKIGQKTCSGVPRNFFRGGGGSTNSVEDRENGDLWGGNPLVRESGNSCNLVQEISFHIVKFSQFLVLQTIYDDNQFICHC